MARTLHLRVDHRALRRHVVDHRAITLDAFVQSPFGIVRSLLAEWLILAAVSGGLLLC
ncbi:hypothetical protein ALP03_102438 [Pseudomonas amygdali pv. tabaci]|uniref:Uncharacterized protein n=2 Tax=Pseudomonas amygdali TaxID=47877 RepID=A0A3M6HNN4_PSEAJ|nr:hypothetical protein ALO63_102650 [Pseudomonas amygdali pv. mori]RMW06549.1 hypothetical protein ALP03_102438 [Pseudomonas amygdali pv. tabaci]